MHQMANDILGYCFCYCGDMDYFFLFLAVWPQRGGEAIFLGMTRKKRTNKGVVILLMIRRIITGSFPLQRPLTIIMFSSDGGVGVRVLRIPIKVEAEEDSPSFARRMARRRKSETLPEYDFHDHNKRVSKEEVRGRILEEGFVAF